MANNIDILCTIFCDIKLKILKFVLSFEVKHKILFCKVYIIIIII